jgi:transposase
MSLVELSAVEHRSLREIAKRAHDARQVKRAQALLWLDEGESVETVARQQSVSCQTVYNWVGMFQKRCDESVAERLQDRPRPGRPPDKRQAVQAMVQEVIDQDPRQWGYRSPVWTTPLLHCHLDKACGVDASKRTIRRALRGLGYRYKRPRYVLSRRSPTWRQAKGGCSEG